MRKIMKYFWLFACLLLIGSIRTEDKVRLDCLLNEPGITESVCKQRECHYNPVTTHPREPFCYLDTSKVGYSLKGATTHRANGLDATLTVNPRAHKSLPFPPIEQLKLETNYITENILRIRIIDPAHKRYEVPIQSEFNIPSGHPSQTKYDVTLNNGEFHLVVTRKDSGTKIIDTSIGGLLYGDRFIQFVTNLASNDVYGVGENFQTSFKHSFTGYHTYPMFTQGRAVSGEKEKNGYSVHPFFTVMEKDGKSHGFFLLNSNAMAFTMLAGPAVSMKTTGGVLDLFVFLGDNPEHVVQLYTSVIGRSVMPPFWGLGFQLCRYSIPNLDYYKKVLARNLDNGVPVDIQYLDIDYMGAMREDFQYDETRFKGLPEFVKETKFKHNLHFGINISPVIQADKVGYLPFNEGYKRDVFVKWSNTTPDDQILKFANAPSDQRVFYGHMWPHGPSAYPDFFRNATTQYWVDMNKEFHKTIEFDILWPDMNEPENFGSSNAHCPKDGLGYSLPSLNLPEELNTNTICMGAVQGDHGEYRHYDVHSLYGWSESKATLVAVHESTGKRGFVLSRSTYASSGKYAAHWFGDNYSKWDHLRQSIVAMLQFSLFGMSFTGADICGFNDETTPDLCRRWLQLGAFYPFSRTHNNEGVKLDQDPGFWIEAGHPEVTKSAVTALRTRYQLMHYLYTLFYRSHVSGETLVRPLHHEFPHDLPARSVDQQFLLGSSILVNPFLFENQTTMKAYIPQGSEWFKLSGDFVEKLNAPSGSHAEFTDSFSDRPLLLRSGSIVPIVPEQKLPKPLNTATLRRVPLELWILPNSTGSAHGSLFYDDGESIATIESGAYSNYEFEFRRCHLIIITRHFGYKAPTNSQDILQISSIKLALPKQEQNLRVTIDGQHVNSTLTGQTLNIQKSLDLLAVKSESFLTLLISNSTNDCIFG